MTTNRTVRARVPRLLSEGDLTEITLEEGAAGMEAMVVVDGLSDVWVRA